MHVAFNPAAGRDHHKADRPRGARDARAAFQAGRIDEALTLWRTLWDTQPGRPAVAKGIARSLIALERPAELLVFVEQLQRTHPEQAENALRLGTRKLPRDIGLGIAFCRLAERDPQVQEAETRWWDLRKRLPRRLKTHLGYIECLLQRGKADEAERATLSALAALGSRFELLEMHAKVAEAGRNWPDAACRWAHLLEVAPSHSSATQRGAEAAHHALSYVQRAPARVADAPPRLPPITQMDPEQLTLLRRRLTHFESIGRNCEFGLLQRSFGAEPLGLLRFATTRSATLLKLLNTRFDGIGDPGRMAVELVRDEYRLRHLPSGWRMHTGIKAGTATTEAVLNDQCRHTSFLRTKLIRDLTRSGKIFVYQMAGLTTDTAIAIHDAVQDYGPSLVMAVRIYTQDQPAGTVEWPRERLMIASIDRQGQEFAGAGWDTSIDYWLHFCAIAEERWRAMQTIPPDGLALAPAIVDQPAGA